MSDRSARMNGLYNLPLAQEIGMYEGMGHPMRHVRCGRVHDAALVEVLQRYSDCSRWKCPHCGGWCDDRPIGWGGSVERFAERGGSDPDV